MIICPNPSFYNPPFTLALGLTDHPWSNPLKEKGQGMFSNFSTFDYQVMRWWKCPLVNCVDNVYPDTIRDTWSGDKRHKHREWSQGHTMLSEIMETNYSIVQGIFGGSSYYSKDMKIYKAQWTGRAAIKSPILLGLFSRGGSLQQIELHSKCLHWEAGAWTPTT